MDNSIKTLNEIHRDMRLQWAQASVHIARWIQELGEIIEREQHDTTKIKDMHQQEVGHQDALQELGVRVHGLEGHQKHIDKCFRDLVIAINNSGVFKGTNNG